MNASRKEPTGASPVKTFKVDALAVRIYRTSTDLADDAARLARQHLQEAVSRQGAAAVILATGNSQIQFLDSLAAPGDVDWSRVTFFHMDEYLGIDASHRASFRRYLRERVEARVQPKQFHYIEG